MIKYVCFYLILFCAYRMLRVVTVRGDVTDGTELVLTFMTHRHGDRTPVEFELSLTNNTEGLEQLIKPWGFGQLTNVGRRTAYSLGKFIRRRYNELLSPTYNESEIYIRSTDSTRTKMTVLTALAAVFPATGDTWSEDINWVPVPYTTMPAKWDFNEAFSNCPLLRRAVLDMYMKPNKRMVKFKDVIDKISQAIKYDITQKPLVIGLLNDFYVSEVSLGYDIGSEVPPMPDVKAAVNEAYDTVFGDDNYIALEAGVLLQEFFTAAASVIAGMETPRVRVYSAHDYNVYSLAAVAQITPRQGPPEYGSLFAVELRKVVKTDKYVVLPVYLPSPGKSEIYVAVKDCGIPCDFDKFKEITSKYVLDETQWRKKCLFTDDMNIDTNVL